MVEVKNGLTVSFKNKKISYHQFLHYCTFKECSSNFMRKVTHAHHWKLGNHRKERNMHPYSPILGKTLLNVVVHLLIDLYAYVCVLGSRTLKA